MKTCNNGKKIPCHTYKRNRHKWNENLINSNTNRQIGKSNTISHCLERFKVLYVNVESSIEWTRMDEGIFKEKSSAGIRGGQVNAIKMTSENNFRYNAWIKDDMRPHSQKLLLLQSYIHTYKRTYLNCSLCWKQ